MATADGGGGTLLSDPWEPLSSVDFGILGFVATFQTAALLVCVHLLWWRKWPPYVTKNVNLVVIATVSGVLWTIAMVVACGFVEREAGDILAACDLETFLTWTTLGVHTVAFFIRMYRMWRILIKHDDKMWRTEHQILLVSSFSLIPVLSTWAIPDTVYFDEVANTCYSATTSRLITLGMDLIGLFGICFLWFVCARQLKSVRKQFNEYETMKRTLLYTSIALLSYPVVVLFVLGDDLTTQRRVAIFYPLLTTYILLWGSIREPFLMKMLGDDEYLWSYTKGFSELPSPAQLKASLAEQLSVDQLRQEFRRYVKTRVAQELVDFYLDSLDREEVTGFFERQAVTMRIVEQFIRDGAPDQVNLSEECREKVLATDVTAYDIFDDARKEVLGVMETNFQRDFVTSEGYQRMLDAAEEEQRELRLLRAGGIMPLGTPPLPGSAAPKSPSPPSPPSPPATTDGRGSFTRPLSPPLIYGLVDAIKKLPFLAKHARAVSESRRRQRSRSSSAGGARIGGAARLSAGAAGAGGSDLKHGEVLSPSPASAFSVQGETVGGREAQGTELTLARKLPAAEGEDEDDAVTVPASVIGRREPRLARKEASHTGGPCDGGHGGDGGGGGGRGVDTANRRHCDDRGAGGGAGAGLAAVSAGAAATPRGREIGVYLGGNGHVIHNRNPRSQDRGGESRRKDDGNPKEIAETREGGFPFRVAVPPQPSSSALSVSASSSGPGRRWASSESPSADSLRGIPSSCRPRPGVGGSPEKRGRRAEEGGAGGERGGWAGGEEGVDAAGTAGSREISTGAGILEVPAAAKAGMTYEYCNAESNAAAGAGRERRMAAYVSGSGRRLPPLTLPSGGSGGSTDVFDWVSREDGIEGLDVLSSVTTEDSPDWVRFSDWIRNGKDDGSAPGGEYGGRGSAGDERKTLRHVEEGFGASYDGGGGGGCGVGGRPGEVQPSRCWDSGGSSWSNIKDTTAGGSDVAEATAGAPETPHAPPSAEEA